MLGALEFFLILCFTGITVCTGWAIILLLLFTFSERDWKYILPHVWMRRIALYRFKKYSANPEWAFPDPDNHFVIDVEGVEAGDTIRCFQYTCGCIGGRRKLIAKYSSMRHSGNRQGIGEMMWGDKLRTAYMVGIKKRRWRADGNGTE